MNVGTLILRSLRFHARSHLGVVLGAAVGSAALVGALVVGDSVRESLHDMALARLGRVTVAMPAGDRLFRAQLADDLSSAAKTSSNHVQTAAVLQLPGTAAIQDGSARANNVQVLGVDENFWQLASQPPAWSAQTNTAADAVVLNNALASQLHVKIGDSILLRIQKPSLLSRDAPISPQSDLSIAWRVKVQAIATDEQLGRFSLQANQIAPFNAFVNLAALQHEIGETNRANLLLCSDDGDGKISLTNRWTQLLAAHWQLADGELELRALPGDAGVELRSSRVFLDRQVVAAAREIDPETQPILTYLANELRSPPFAAPYSMVTAMGAPIVPQGMKYNEIIINDWLAEDLHAQPGEPLTLTYYVIGNGRALEERQQEFRIRSVIPLAGAAADRTLMPDFPGLAQADSTSDWDAGFPVQLQRIRLKDEQYWKQHRGTPKAFIKLESGEKMWSNRFGNYTALRFPQGTLETIRAALFKKITPASLGLTFQSVREQALAASSQAVDFGGLFIGFSMFLIVAALLLMGLLFQFGLEQRAAEIGTLLALGFRPRQVRRLFLSEGALLALIGGVIGAVGGIFYARAMLFGLATIWRNAVGTSSLQYHATPLSLVMGTLASAIVGTTTIWLTLRRQARQPARELLAGESGEGSKKTGKCNWGFWLGGLTLISAVTMIGQAVAVGDTNSAETFFSGGTLLLISGLGFCSAWLKRIGDRRNPKARLTLISLGLRNCGRRRKRSLATIGLLACGIFLILAIGAFHMDANQDAGKRSSGTGGFLLVGESSLPVTYDLNGKAGREFYDLNSPLMKNVRTVAFRVHDGDEASCLNLNRAQTPRLLGVNAAALRGRNAFTFAETITNAPAGSAWGLLETSFTNEAGEIKKISHSEDEIPAIGDENSILWALGKKVGDTVDYVDGHGQPFKVRLVGAVANSILQGNLIIDEEAFLKRFPNESGYRMFLFEGPPDQASNITALLSRSLRDVGLELTPATQRLNAFNAVQNTYLSTFQVLGGLGLLLGSAGLGVVVLRNVQERRGELATLLALGYRRRMLRRLVLGEHGALLGLGLCVGGVAAAIAVWPALNAPGAQVPWLSLALTTAAVCMNGLIWTWLAARFALRGKLLTALRNE